MGKEKSNLQILLMFKLVYFKKIYQKAERQRFSICWFAPQIPINIHGRIRSKPGCCNLVSSRARS